MLTQISLEADLCYGRNKYCKEYFKRRYPAQKLIKNIVNPDVHRSLKSSLMRVLTYVYIDDPPHELIKYSRAFKAYEGNKNPDEFIKTSIYEEPENIEICNTSRLHSDFK